MPDMTSAEMESYLAEARIADLVTLREDGSPHVAPVWYQYRAGRLAVMANDSAVKVRNIRRDPRVAVSIPTPDEPYRYVLIEGTATVSREQVAQTVTEISVHYRGQERGAKFAREMLEGSAMVVIEISPARTIAWQSDD